jgi:hypothetical protein
VSSIPPLWKLLLVVASVQTADSCFESRFVTRVREEVTKMRTERDSAVNVKTDLLEKVSEHSTHSLLRSIVLLVCRLGICTTGRTVWGRISITC